MRGIIVVVQPVCWGDFVIVGLFIVSVCVYDLKMTGYFTQVTSVLRGFFSDLRGSYKMKRRNRLKLKQERKRRSALQKRRRRRRLYR